MATDVQTILSVYKADIVLASHIFVITVRVVFNIFFFFFFGLWRMIYIYIRAESKNRCAPRFNAINDI